MPLTSVPGTEPYAWPYDGRLDPSGLGLIVCGAQRQFVDASLHAGPVGARLADVATIVRGCGGRVIWLRHGRRAATDRSTAWLPLRESAAWALVGCPAAGDVVVDAAGWDGCYASDLEHTLRTERLANVAIGGFASELTVDSTVRTLNDRGLECLVLTDGCAPLDRHLGHRAHRSLTMSGGIFGALGTIDALTATLNRASGLATERSSA